MATNTDESLAPGFNGPDAEVGSALVRRPVHASRRVQGIGFLFATCMLAINLAATQPLLERIGRSDWVGPTYLMIRVAVTLFYALWLSLWLRSTQGTIFRAVTLLGFLDQVVLKFALIQGKRYWDPQSWLSDLGASGSVAGSASADAAAALAASGATNGADVGAGSILIGLGMSYALFVPFLVLMTFLVSEMGEAVARRMRR